MNRRGERGKPVERVQQANFNFNNPELRNELAQALADPGVRAFLEADPELAARFRKELAQLAIGPVEENGKVLPPGEPVDLQDNGS